MDYNKAVQGCTFDIESFRVLFCVTKHKRKSKEKNKECLILLFFSSGYISVNTFALSAEDQAVLRPEDAPYKTAFCQVI